MNKRKIKKRSNGHLINVELEQLKKLVPLVVEMDDLLEGLEAKSIEDFEKNINDLTKFTNAMVSANAFGKEAEYERLLEIESLLNDKLSSKDLTKTKEINPAIISAIIDKHTEFYSPTELKTKQTLEELIQTFNLLAPEERQHIGFNRSNELAFNPYSELRF
jgi:hypothetical protein